MPNTKTQSRQIETQDGREVEVLYQKMGDRWFAFSLIDDEVFVGSISPEELATRNPALAASAAVGEMASRRVHRKSGRA